MPPHHPNRVIARAAGKPSLAALLDHLSGSTMRARIWRAVEDQRATEDTKAEHRRILAALEARDPDLARSASVVHVKGVEDWMRGVIERRA